MQLQETIPICGSIWQSLFLMHHSMPGGEATIRNFHQQTFQQQISQQALFNAITQLLNLCRNAAVQRGCVNKVTIGQN